MAPSRLPTDPPPSPTLAIKRRAIDLGFDLVGIAPAERPTHADYYLEWLSRGFAGEMAYLSRTDAVHRRLNPDQTLPGARSIIVVAINYHVDQGHDIVDPARPIIARYARGTDYHDVFEQKLELLARSLSDVFGTDVGTRAYVDYGPVLERDHAQQAGLGWIAKNTMLIHPRIGSYTFLGEILTDAALEPDIPFQADHCGTCERCIDACPTGAIRGPREIDARLCISYLTIELRGPIPRRLRPLIGARIFGCDICQEVCPWNDEIPDTNEPLFRPRDSVTGPQLIELMGLSEETFRELHSGTPLMRCKRRGFLRNVAVALGNWGDPAAVPALIRALHDEDSLVRGHSAWALGRISDQKARTGLQERHVVEQDAWVKEEIELALA